MSDLKNVLKAGFLLTASFLATGCGGDTADNPKSNDPNTPSKPSNPETQIKPALASHTRNVGELVSDLIGNNYSLFSVPVGPRSKDYDVFKVASMATGSTATQLASTGDTTTTTATTTAPTTRPQADANTVVAFVGYDQGSAESYKFDVGSLPPLTDTSKNHIGALILDGKIDESAKEEKGKRRTFVGTLKGDLRLDVLMLRNAVLKPFETESATIESAYTYVGIDAASGYDFLRQNKEGKDWVVPSSVHSQLYSESATTGLASTSVALASTGTTPKEKKPYSNATGDQSEKADDVSVKNNVDKKKDKITKTPVPASNNGEITLITKKPDAATKLKLESSGLYFYEGKGALDIAGRISKVKAADVVITAIGTGQPEIDAVPEVVSKVVDKSVADVVDTPVTEEKKASAEEINKLKAAKNKADADYKQKNGEFDKAKEERTAVVDVIKKAGDKVTEAQKKARNDAQAKVTKAQKELETAKEKKKKAVQALTAAQGGTTATKTTTTAVDSKKASDKTKNSISKGQSAVKKGGAYHFLFEIKDGGYYAEIGELNVGANVEYHVIADHALFVHTLNLQNDLGIRVLAQEHTFDKLTETDLSKFDSSATTPGDKVTHGQVMMTILKEEQHSVQVSKVNEIDSSGKLQGEDTEYTHYASGTKFPLWVSAANVTSGKKLQLAGIDLAAGVVLGTGVYALPLVKDMSNKLPNSANASGDSFTLAKGATVSEWKIMSNGYFDQVLLIKVEAAPTTNDSPKVELASVLMSSGAQGGRSVQTSVLNSVVAKLDPTNLVSGSFANLSSARANQAAQFASLARGVNAANAEKLGAVEHYNVTFNHGGAQFGLTYNLDGGNAFSSNSGTTSFGANVATDVLGLKAIVSAEASVDAGKNAYASSSLASYNAGLTFAKAYSVSGLSVVPMGGFGVSSNALSSYSAVVPMAAGMLGLSMNDVSFNAATFHAGVSVALDDFTAGVTGADASLTLGVAGYLASTANATLSTSEGKSSDLHFAGSAVTPYAQFNLGFASGEKLNTMISSGAVAVNFGLDR